MTAEDAADRAGSVQTEFERLVRQLARDPRTPWGDAFPPADGERVHDPDDPVFDSYCRGAAALVRRGEVDAMVLRAMLDEYVWICGNSLDAEDWVTDLLRAVAAQVGDPDLQELADRRHLDAHEREILIHIHRGEVREALRASRRALAVIAAARERRCELDPAVQGPVLAAIGRAHIASARQAAPAGFEIPPDVMRELGVAAGAVAPFDGGRLAEGVGYLTRATELLAVTDRFQEFLQLSRALEHHGWQLAQAAAGLTEAVGAGRAIDYLETALAAGRAAGEADLEAFAAIELASLLSAVRQPERAEEVLVELLSRPDISAAHRDDASIQLASTLSEQRRFAEAAELQRALLDRDELDGPRGATLLFNLGNSLRMLGDERAAIASYRDALELVAAHPEHERPVGLEGRIHTMLAELQFAAGRVAAAERELALAEPHFTGGGIPALEFNARAARGLFEAGRPRKALARIARSEELLTEILRRGPGPSVWESMFAHWHALPAHAIEILLTRERGAAATRRALVAAERAKGRLLGWLRFGPTQAGAELALEASRHEQVVDRLCAWAAESPRRIAISLFGTDRGLAVLAVLPGGSIRGRWLDEVRYETFMADVYEPWSELLDTSIASERLAIWAGTATDLLLGRVGDWLWRACPELSDGGCELVISSHRLFRNLPLSHCKLPGGRRLGDLFERVLVLSSFAELAECLDAIAPPLAGDVRALSDPDGSLPFARVEGLLATGGDGMLAGAGVTVQATRQALAAPGTVLLSCHGEFDPANPWLSRVQLADGELDVAGVFESAATRRGLLVVLGACETGRNRRSLSDEPLGFPAALVHAGADAVLAPMWPVDDFSSCLYLTHFTSLVASGVHAASAVQQTSAWLCDATAATALELADQWRTMISTRDEDVALWRAALARLDDVAAWLRALEPAARPFRSARDWAAFQLVGVPPDPPTRKR